MWLSLFIYLLIFVLVPTNIVIVYKNLIYAHFHSKMCKPFYYLSLKLNWWNLLVKVTVSTYLWKCLVKTYVQKWTLKCAGSEKWDPRTLCRLCRWSLSIETSNGICKYVSTILMNVTQYRILDQYSINRHYSLHFHLKTCIPRTTVFEFELKKYID